MKHAGRRWAILITGILLGGASMATFGSYHLVRTGSGVLWVSRVAIGWNDLFVDVREWSHEDWRQHPQLSQAVLRAGRRDLLPQRPRLHPGHQWALRAFRGQPGGPREVH